MTTPRSQQRRTRDASSTSVAGSGGSRSRRDSRRVWVIHGRNQAAADALFGFLEALDLRPIDWLQALDATGNPTPYNLQVLNSAFERSQAVLVLMTPDDEARLRPQHRSLNDPPHEVQLTPQARANVLFEAGMAMAREPTRTVLVELGYCRPFSDIAGIHVVHLDDTIARRQQLAQRLANAGLKVDLGGFRWHSAGDFTSALGDVDPAALAGMQGRASTTSQEPIHSAENLRAGGDQRASRWSPEYKSSFYKAKRYDEK